MSEKEEILKENYEEYFSSAENALKNGKFNVATTLFFKSMVALVDLFIITRICQISINSPISNLKVGVLRLVNNVGKFLE